MADDKSKPGSSDPFKSGAKRPYATLDLKATEIKVTPIADKITPFTAATVTAANLPGGLSSGLAYVVESLNLPDPTTVPRPLAAWRYATPHTPAARAQTAPTTAPTAPSPTTPKTIAGAGGAAAAAAVSGTVNPSSKSNSTAQGAAVAQSKPATDTPAPTAQSVVVKKRGGFFSHLAAGIVGGALALGAGEWGRPQLELKGLLPVKPREDAAALAQRLQAIEKRGTSDFAQSLTSIEGRLATLEKSTQTIPSLQESQSRLVAETKAALAAAASDTGAPEQLARLAKVEDRLKALTEAGAADPNAGRLEQLAALTGKVADLETSLATQLTALRKSVAEDVEGRIAAAAQAAEAAKSGTQRIDRDVATLKSDAVRIEERVQVMKSEADKLAAAIKLAQEQADNLKTAMEAVRAGAAKPADVTAAVAPVSQKLASIEQSLQTVMKAEEDRRTNAERVVLALELQNLRRALDRGQGYGPELAEVQKAAGGKVDLSALDKYKATGVPAVTELVKDFRTTANAVIDAATEPANGGVFDKLLAGAKSVVRVRKVDHAADDKSAEAIVGRMEVALNESRLGDVLDQAKSLQPKALDVAKPFLDKVSARVSVDTAVASLESQLKTSLGGPGVSGGKPASAGH